MMWLGMVLVVAASLGAAFSTSVRSCPLLQCAWTNQKRQPVGVIMTQGVLYGIGSGFLFAPSISFIDEWFLLRRGIANGIL